MVIAAGFIERCQAAMKSGEEKPEFPERELEQYVHNTWTDTGKAMVNNWLGLVYQLTNRDRKRQFMPGVDPHNPLQIRASD
jgi:homoserine O-succinyltransferase